ncbi:MAG TPA: DUF302 domain-containing protein, partial [Longimicrobiales bacterium]|nr:DUF302 domain-containing protein [Longimicrobiales bacterium]
YLILGACNPPLARQALAAEREIGLLLPCNIVVYGEGTGGTAVSIMDPEAALALTGNEAIAPLAAEVKAKLERVIGALAGDA